MYRFGIFKSRDDKRRQISTGGVYFSVGGGCGESTVAYGTIENGRSSYLLTNSSSGTHLPSTNCNGNNSTNSKNTLVHCQSSYAFEKNASYASLTTRIISLSATHSYLFNFSNSHSSDQENSKKKKILHRQISYRRNGASSSRCSKKSTSSKNLSDLK